MKPLLRAKMSDGSENRLLALLEFRRQFDQIRHAVQETDQYLNWLFKKSNFAGLLGGRKFYQKILPKKFLFIRHQPFIHQSTRETFLGCNQIFDLKSLPH